MGEIQKMKVNKYKGTCAICGNLVPCNAGRLVREGRSFYPVHLACHEAKNPQVNTITFSSGETITKNKNGRCEDAPCCGCCTG